MEQPVLLSNDTLCKITQFSTGDIVLQFYMISDCHHGRFYPYSKQVELTLCLEKLI